MKLFIFILAAVGAAYILSVPHEEEEVDVTTIEYQSKVHEEVPSWND